VSFEAQHSLYSTSLSLERMIGVRLLTFISCRGVLIGRALVYMMVREVR
jgi:hypothetical protein